ncbi:MAG TPA: hypothetical protein VK279_04285 [Solirubrobacteraceae bacterium]|nr:hypothetical protein [Solirubrobacteraceae bacterium]
MELLAFPNVSEGRHEAALAAIRAGFQTGTGARVIDAHSDPDHHRTAFTLAGPAGALAGAVAAGAREVVARVHLDEQGGGRGVHPFVGALDVAAIVWPDERRRGAACAEALVLGDTLARDLGVPVFLYGALAGGRTRAQVRRGGLPGLARRMAAGDLRPDFGPPAPHPTAGVTLVAARPPLVAFNLEVDATLEQAREVAAWIREGGPEGLPGLRALGLALPGRRVVQVSCNVERPDLVALADVVSAVGRHVPVLEAELVGLAPRRALEGFPSGLPLHGRRVLEDQLLS